MAYEQTYFSEFARPLRKNENPEQYLSQELPKLKKRMLELHKAKEIMAKGFAEALVGLKMAYPELNLDDDNFQGTPDRMARALIEMCQGLGVNQEDIFSTSFPIGHYDEVVLLKDIEFVSLCSHHFFPFVGIAHIGYIPGPKVSSESKSKVVGLSKLARIVDMHARRPQLQERMCADILAAIVEELKPAGSMVMIEGKHSCLGCRGPRKPHSTMVTSAMDGKFKESTQLRSEFLNLLHPRLRV